MAAAATLPTLAGNLPAAWTVRGMDAWLTKLPAEVRAQLRWAVPGLEAALDGLLAGALDEGTVDAAAHRFTVVVLRCRALLQRILGGQISPAQHQARLLPRIPEVAAFLGEPLSASHAEKAIRAAVAISRGIEDDVLKRSEGPEVESLAAALEDGDMDALAARLLQPPVGAVMRGYVLLAALLESLERRGSAEQGRRLARLALVHMLWAIRELRGEGVRIDLYPGDSAELVDDRRLDAVATLVSEECSTLELQLLGGFPRRNAAPAHVPSPPPPQIQRSMTYVTGVQFRPYPALMLEGQAWWLGCSPELLGRALLLREQPVQVLLLVSAAGSSVLRIDAASDRDAPDAATRTADMLRDWDELLHRLAR